MTSPDSQCEWLAWRTRGIGASEVAGVLGISPWATPYSVWQSKVNGGGSGSSHNAEAMRWGQLLEHAILAEVERRLDIHVAGEQTWCTHRARGWAIATVDAFFGESPEFAIADALGVVEVKTTSEPRWDDVPAHYQAQVQWQLEVTDLDHAWVACLHNGRRLSLWPIERDRDTGAALLDAMEQFWTRHVLTGDPPPLDGRPATTAALASRYADSEPELVADLSPVAVELDTLRLVRAEIDMLGEERDRLENEIKAAMGAAEAGELDGVRAVTWKASTSKRIDTARLREEMPTLAAQYSTETTTRRFLLKEKR